MCKLEKQLSERDAALARCVELVDAEPELQGEMPDALWYKLKMMAESGDRIGVEATMRSIVRATKKGIRQRITASFPTSTQAAANVLAAARRLAEAWKRYDLVDTNGLVDASRDMDAAELSLYEAIREDQEDRSSEKS